MLNKFNYILTAITLLCFYQNQAQVHFEKISEPQKISIKDMAAPKIEITNLDILPDVPYTFTGEQLIFVGYTTDNQKLKYFIINRDTVKTDEEGFFNYGIYLSTGSNYISMEAADVNGNKANYKYTVLKEGIASRNNPVILSAPVQMETGNGKYYALIIGINNYKDSRLVSLDRPAGDAKKIHSILTSKYTFDKDNAYLLTNPTRADIINTLDDLSNELTEEDNLLIFYAGHGYWDEDKSTGYWLPSDADRYKTSNWLRNSTVQGYIEDIPAKHTLLIADACFSGGIFKTRKAFNDAPESIEHLYDLKSRKGMTSGMLKEVPDQSVFIDYLTKRLENNEHKYTSSLDLFYQLRVPVMNNSNNTPQYGTIQNTGDEGGEFIFIQR